MAKTVIQIKKETREKIKALGMMGETYDDVLDRLCVLAHETMMARVLLDTSDSTDLKEVLKKRSLL